MRLYDINEELRKLWDKVMSQDGELTEEDIKALEELNLAKDEKIKGYGVIIRELETEIGCLRAESKRLKELTEKKEKRCEWLANRLKDFMLGNGINKFDSVEVNISFRKSYTVMGAEEDLKNGTLSKTFINQTIIEKPDKTAIKDYLKDGGTLKGCYIGVEEHIQIK